MPAPTAPAEQRIQKSFDFTLFFETLCPVLVAKAVAGKRLGIVAPTLYRHQFWRWVIIIDKEVYIENHCGLLTAIRRSAPIFHIMLQKFRFEILDTLRMITIRFAPLLIPVIDRFAAQHRSWFRHQTGFTELCYFI